MSQLDIETMRSVDEKTCYSYASSQDSSSTNSSYTNHKSRNNQHHQNKVLNSRTKPTPSKWDDAQKWLVGLSGDRNHGKTKPRNSNADDRRLLSSLSQNGRNSCSSMEGVFDYSFILPIGTNGMNMDEGETKKIDCESTVIEASPVVSRSICLRDMGTEMTPIASKEPSRTGTPLRAVTPVVRSPISSRSSTPGRRQEGQLNGSCPVEMRNGEALAKANGEGGEGKGLEDNGSGEKKDPNSLESRAIAWDEAERAKYMARYKREEVKIQAWENHEKRRAELEMKRAEVKAERMKARAQEKLANKLAATRRMAEEKRASAEAKLNERAARTSESADYIRRTGHLPSSFFSFKLPSLCG
ncbi:Remorin [Rhynchospora pubera]|uniref:Remorin n=1 Tax=Rhynchospora pubera TaxID=906938 RepID=A0AAV8FNU2_9POAL|nr:Remorin [Rhynchospora pubera]